MKTQLVLSPEPEPETRVSRIQHIVDWWNALRISDDPGAAIWEELERLEHEVTDCLAKQSPDVDRGLVP